MLVITRKSSENFTIGDDITVTIGEVRGNQIRVIIDAPKTLAIKRDNMKQNKESSIKATKNQAKDGTFSREGSL